MIVGVPKETFPDERRVALVPIVLAALKGAGMEVLVESGAGDEAGYPDADYQSKGAAIAASRAELFEKARIIVQVRGLGANPDEGNADLELMRPEHVVIGFMDPLGTPEAAKALANRGVTAFSMELIPRISRAQSMDALSSLGTVAGYAAVLLAAGHLPKMFPMMMTAAGTITPARIFVMGAGVAGLQAIATSRRMGAVVQAYDVRPAAKEQVESLGAKFVELPLETEGAEDAGGYAKAQGEEFLKKQRELMAKVVADSDVVITTAAIPGRKSPILVTAEMVAGMSPQSVIVDLAAERGGNCELTRADEVVVEHGVTIFGPTNLPTTVPFHSSQMFAKNVTAFLKLLVKEGEIALDLEDEIIRDTLIVRDGEVASPRLRELLELEPVGDAERSPA
jgi:NAD(P) transhydrogenase subunit alpha